MKINSQLVSLFNPQFGAFLAKYYPNGGDLLKILQNVKKKDEQLSYAFSVLNFLDLSEQDRRELQELLQIHNSIHLYNSFNIENSINITYSKNVSNSSFIFFSENVTNCDNCSTINNCSDSSFLYMSDFCEESNYLIESKSCKKSSNIIKSVMILDSIDLCNCNNIIRGGQLVNCDRTKDTYFSSWCNKLNFSFFCSRVQGDYLLFNEPFDQDLYEMILAQYKTLVKPLTFVSRWPEEGEISGVPNYTLNFKKYYLTQTDKFWEWVETLPNYNPKILYEITCLPRFLKI